MKAITQISLIVTITFLAACGTSKKSQEETREVKAPKVEGKEISYSADSLTMNGYIAYDVNTEGTQPGILVVHEWWGHNEYARERADMLAEMGYVALAVDMYGDGKQAAHPEDAMKFTGEVLANLDGAKARFESAMQTLKANENVDGDKIGAIGYCFGGSVVLSMANAGFDLDAVAAFHGGIGLPIWPGEEGVKAKILVCNGADDPFVTDEQLVNFKNKMDSASVDYQYITYKGAVHSFTSKYADEMGGKFDMPLAYNAAADSASWEEMKKLFKDIFK
ncbi:MAG: dienelactone hydrolase family protein [Cytophagales bacterium]|nr:dienelactone hydrolase family protein [Cytophagales bacterium]